MNATFIKTWFIIALAVPGLSSAGETKDQQPLIAVIEISITDKQVFMEYVQGHIPTIHQYGGGFVAEYVAQAPLKDNNVQGVSNWDMVVIQTWPDKETFMKWWHSSEYAPWKQLRPSGASVKLTFAHKMVH